MGTEQTGRGEEEELDRTRKIAGQELESPVRLGECVVERPFVPLPVNHQGHVGEGISIRKSPAGEPSYPGPSVNAV